MKGPTFLANQVMDGAAATVPCPPRFWWLKRLALAGGLLLLALVGVYAWWAHEARRRFDAKVAEIVATGEPLYAADFEVEPIPDDQNAAVLLTRAVESLKELPEGPSLATLLDRYDRTGRPPPATADLIERNAEALRLIRLARGLRADWGERPDPANVRANWASLRSTIKLLEMIASHQRSRGADAAALETLLDAAACARSMAAAPTTMLAWLSAVSETRRLADAVERYVAPLGAARHAERRAALTDLAGMLLEDRWMDEARRNAMRFERAMIFSWIRQACDGADHPPNRFDQMFSRPYMLADGALALEYMTAYVRSAAAPSPQAGDRISPAFPTFGNNLQRNAHLLTAILLPSYRGMLLNAWRDQTRCRLAGLALGIRRFELEHGRRPERLEELTPDCVAALPLDPFAAGEAPLLYAPTAPARVYSVGENEVDDGGLDEAAPGDRVGDDIVFYLDGRYEPAPSTQGSRPFEPSGARPQP